MSPNSISEYLLPKFSWGGSYAPRSPSIILACLADCALHNIGSLCVYMGSYIFLYIQKCPEILPNQCEIAFSAPAYPSLGFCAV